jgi:hypothetical protein
MFKIISTISYTIIKFVLDDFYYFTNFFFYNNNFFKVIEKTEQTLSAENFFKTLIDLSRFLGYVFIWVFPDFLDTPF